MSNNNSAAMSWSDEQNAIFSEFSDGTGHFVVNACAGTGKTTTVKEGISRAPEAKKVYVAFNKKNVDEAKKKITDPNCQVMSLNGLGYRYVVRNWEGSKPDDAVEYDRVRAVSHRAERANRTIVSEIVKILAFAKNTCPFAKHGDLVRLSESRGFGPEPHHMIDEGGGWTVEEFCQIALDAMNLAKTKRDAQKRISFNDQIWLPVVNGWIRGWFDLVCVDECQDMNSTQLILAQRACKKDGRMVLVGDPRQAIYAFRGADVRGMERLTVALNAKTLPLTTTYRCPRTVVEQAKRLVPHYQAAPNAAEGVVRGTTEALMLKEIQIGDAVVSRKNGPLMGLCLSMLRAGVPARIEGRDIGKKLLKIAQDLKASTVPAFIESAQAWGARKAEHAAALKDGAGDELVQEITDTVETLVAVADEAGSVAEIESRLVNLFSDTSEGPRPAVVLSSVHKAKGLEWKRVYLLQGTFTQNWNETASEEANIKYVAITRAMSELVWITDQKFFGRKGAKRAQSMGTAVDPAEVA
jgi:DNA helicase-2/ATP-dependent DNA helicase PcrA